MHQIRSNFLVQKNVTILFGCLEEAIKNAPLKELEFCADGITKRFLYPTLFNLKESNRSVEAALACVSTLSSTVRTILADSPSFCLAQRAELLHSSLGILQNTDSMPLHVRQAAANTLTFMVHLPPNIGQLTRCSILRAALSTLVDSLDLQGATIRQDVIPLQNLHEPRYADRNCGTGDYPSQEDKTPGNTAREGGTKA